MPVNSNLPAPSYVNEPSKLNPCPTVWYVLVLTKVQGKGTLALPKNLPRLLITSWQRKDVWKTLFQNKSGGTINPVYLPRKLLNTTKNVSIKKNTVYLNSCPILYPATLEEHQMNNCDPDRVLFGNHAIERNASTLIQDLGRDDIEGHLLEQLLKPIQAIKESTLKLWQVCRPVQSCRSWRTHTGLGSVDIPRRRTRLFPIKTSQLIFESTLPQLRRQQLGAQGFNILSICLSD